MKKDTICPFSHAEFDCYQRSWVQEPQNLKKNDQICRLSAVFCPIGATQYTDQAEI